ncbi:hypothetical protein [Streptomyces sp. 900105755]
MTLPTTSPAALAVVLVSAADAKRVTPNVPSAATAVPPAVAPRSLRRDHVGARWERGVRGSGVFEEVSM